MQLSLSNNKTNTFGLDIGATSLRLVELKKDEKGLFIDSVGVSPISSKEIMSESTLDHQILADSIKKLVSQTQVKSRSVNIAIPQSQVYAKILEMPELSDKELSAALVWEMEQYIPLPLDQVRTDWQVLESYQKDGRKMMSVLIIAVPKSIIVKYEQIVSLAGLELASIETEIISVQRALSPIVATPDPSLIIHLGASTTDLIISKNEIIDMIFSIGLGGLAVTRAISVDLGIDIHDAENYKNAYGLNNNIFEGKIGKALSPILESIVADVKKALFLYREKSGVNSLKQVILSGSNALLPGIDVYFTNALNIQVVLGNAWTLRTINGVPDQVMADFPSYNVALGLALRDFV